MRFFNIALQTANDEDDKFMARMGLSKMLKYKTIEEILYKKPKPKPSHKNNIQALNEVFNGN